MWHYLLTRQVLSTDIQISEFYPYAKCRQPFTTCKHGCSNEIIQMLVKSWQQSMDIATNYGLLLLHCACKWKLPLTIIQLLVQVWPDAVCSPDIDGCLACIMLAFIVAQRKVYNFCCSLGQNPCNTKQKKDIFRCTMPVGHDCPLCLHHQSLQLCKNGIYF